MRLTIFLFLIIPYLGISQTFERILSEENFQYPVDLIETAEGFLLLTQEGESDDEIVQSSIYKLDKQGEILNRKIFNEFYIDHLSNVVSLDNNTFLVAGNLQKGESDSMNISFRLINSNLQIITHIEVKTIVPGTIYDGFISKQAELIKTDNTIIYAFGYHAIDNASLRGVYLIKTNELLNDVVVHHYKNLPLPYYSLPECLLPMQKSDTTLLFLPGKVYKIDANAKIVDSLPNDFTTFYSESSNPKIYRPLSAIWLDERLFVNGESLVFRYKNNLDKDDFVQITDFVEENYAAYYNCSSANDSYFYNCSTADVDKFWHGRESSIRLLKMNSEMEIIWDKRYHEDDGWYYLAFNSLATQDGGCIIAGTKNNIDSMGYNVDVLLLKVDSTGNYDTITSVISTNKLHCKVYPNPGKEYFTIDFTKSFSDCSVFFYNNSGVLVKKVALGANHTNISTSELNSGLYFYIIRNNDQILNQGKWIKE